MIKGLRVIRIYEDLSASVASSDTVSVCHKMVSTCICFRKVRDSLIAFFLQVVIQENMIYSFECNISFHLLLPC